MDYSAFLLERHEPHGIPSPCGHSCMIHTIVSLTAMPSFSHITDVLTISQSLKTDNRHTTLFHVMQYGDDIIGQELTLDENCLVSSGSQTLNLLNSCADDNKD